MRLIQVNFKLEGRGEGGFKRKRERKAEEQKQTEEKTTTANKEGRQTSKETYITVSMSKY